MGEKLPSFDFKSSGGGDSRVSHHNYRIIYVSYYATITWKFWNHFWQ